MSTTQSELSLPKLLWPTWGALSTFPMMGVHHAHVLAFYARASANIFEMGAGGSTLFLAQIAPSARLTTIEHDARWRADVTALYEAMAGTYCLMTHKWKIADYDAEFAASHAPYDLVFIDGEVSARVEWMGRMAPHLRSGGVMVLHDSERDCFQAGIADFPGETIYDEPDTTYGAGTVRLWVGRKS